VILRKRKKITFLNGNFKYIYFFFIIITLIVLELLLFFLDGNRPMIFIAFDHFAHKKIGIL